MAITVDNSGAPYSVTLTITGGVSVAPEASTGEITLTYDLSAGNPQGWSGTAVLPVTDAMLTNEMIDSITTGTFSAYQDGNEIPCHVVYANTEWFGYTMAQIPNYAKLIAPAASYDASTNKTYWAHLGAMHSLWIQPYDHSTGRWSEAVFVGPGSFSAAENNEHDNHGNPAFEKDANGVIHLFGGAHNTPLKHFTSVDYETWTEEADVGATVTYPQLKRTSDDLLLFHREHSESPDYIVTTMRKQSASADFASGQRITEMSKDAPRFVRNRDYMVWSEFDSAGDLHCMFCLHQDCYPDPERRNYHFYVVLEFTHDASGHVSAWRWKDIAGNYLLAENTALTWAAVTVANCWIAGINTDSIPIIKQQFPASAYATDQTYSFQLDENERPHVLITERTAADLSTADVWHVTWDGSQWTKALALPSGSVSEYRAHLIVKSSTDMTAFAARRENDKLDGSSKWGILRYDGTSWTEEVFAPSGPHTVSNTLLDGVFTREAVIVKNAPDGSPAAIASLAARSFGGGLAVFAWDSDGNLLRGRNVQARVAASVNSVGTAEITLKPNESGAQPIANAYPGYSRVIHWDQANVTESIEANGNLFDDVLSEGEPRYFSSRTASPSPVPIVSTELGFGLSFDFSRSPIDGIDTSAVPVGWGNNTATTYGALAGQAYQGACIRLFSFKLTGISETNRMYIAHCDEDPSANGAGVWTFVDRTANEIQVGQYITPADTYASVSKTIDPLALNVAAGCYGPTTITAAINGDQATAAVSQQAQWSIFEADRLGMRRRRGVSEFTHGVIAETRIAYDVTESEWTSGRMEVETYALKNVTNPAMVTATLT